jgi:hypothetical protein
MLNLNPAFLLCTGKISQWDPELNISVKKQRVLPLDAINKHD